jgi:sortase A
MRKLLVWLSNSLIALGLVILIGTGGVYGYSLYEQAQVDRELASMTPVVPDAWTPEAVATATPRPEPTSTPEAASSAVDSHAPTSVPRDPQNPAKPTATARSVYPAVRIEAPAIHLDAKVVESPIINGEWQIPKFAAGHLQGTAQPLQGSNVVLAGHVQSISSGDVFANVDQLRPDDVIRLYTEAAVVTYKVDKVEVVANNDMKPISPTTHEVLTLITCTGTWLPLEHDYSQRTVVIASRVANGG